MADSQSPLPSPTVLPTPLWWRLAIGTAALALGGLAWLVHDPNWPQVQAGLGVMVLLLVAACFSANLRAVNWRTVGMGLALQVALALFILKFELPDSTSPTGTWRPGYQLFHRLGQVVTKFIEFTDAGSRMLFGILANPPVMQQMLDRTGQTQQGGYIFAFTGLMTIIFVSSFFTVLYFFGILQWVVRAFARVMMYLMGTSGAETLSATANVFMGQTEAPLIIKPYLVRMTQSELLAVMVGGMATISGGLMAVYMGFGADPVAIITTSVMAAPCSLYLTKLILPETETPLTAGKVQIADVSPHRNVIDAAAAGASDGMHLALNVAAMLIAFLAMLALINHCLGLVLTHQSLLTTLIGQVQQGEWPWVMVNVLVLYLGWLGLLKMVNRIRQGRGREPLTWQGERRWAWVGLLVGYLVGLDLLLRFLSEATLSLSVIFGFVFSPLAFLMGTPINEIPQMAELLGIKLAANEFVAYVQLNTYRAHLSERSIILATYALTGFANFGSVGIQIGGIGAMAPERRADLARLGMTALMIGFLVSILNASLAGMLL